MTVTTFHAFQESRIHETITLAEIDKQKYKPKIKPTNEIMGTGDKMVWDEDVERKRRLEDAFKYFKTLSNLQNECSNVNFEYY